MPRQLVDRFITSNRLYAGGTVSFLEVDEDGVETGDLIPLFAGTSGATQVAQPLTLDSWGLLPQPVYYEAAHKVRAQVPGLSLDHKTGVFRPPEEGEAGVTTFLGLTDAPDDYAGQANKLVQVNAGADGLQFLDIADLDIPEDAGGAETFLELTDTPASYTDQATKLLRVNVAGTGIEFLPVDDLNIPTPNPNELPSFTIADARRVLTVNDAGDASEWVRRLGHDLPGRTSVNNSNLTTTVGTTRQIIEYGTDLTADRTLTLSTTGAYDGLHYLILRTGGGSFNLTVAGLWASQASSFVLGQDESLFVYWVAANSTWRILAFNRIGRNEDFRFNTLTAPLIATSAKTVLAVDSSSGAVALTAATANVFTTTLDENVTDIEVTGWPSGYARLDWFITQDAATPRTVAGWPAEVTWPDGGSAPDFSTVGVGERVHITLERLSTDNTYIYAHWANEGAPDVSGAAAWRDGVPVPTSAERLNRSPSLFWALTEAQRADVTANLADPTGLTVPCNDSVQWWLAQLQPGDHVVVDCPVLISGNNSDATTRIFITQPNVTITFTANGAFYFDDLAGSATAVRHLVVLADGVKLLYPRIIQINDHADNAASITARAAIHVGDEGGTLTGSPVSVTGFTCIGAYVYGTCGPGILLELCTGFLIVGTHIERTLKDGVHISRVSAHGNVIGLTAKHTGDDGLAIVANTNSSDCVRDVFATCINIEDTGARGVSILGGEDCFVEATIKDPSSSGFYIHRESNSDYDLRPTRRCTIKGRVVGTGKGHDPPVSSVPRAGVYIGQYADDITVDVDVSDGLGAIATIGDSSAAGAAMTAPPTNIKGRINGKDCRSGITIQGARDFNLDLVAVNCGNNGVNLVNVEDGFIPRAYLRNVNNNMAGNNTAAFRFKDADRITVGRLDTLNDTWRLPYNNATKSGYFARGAIITGATSGATGRLVQEHDNWSGASTYWLVVRGKTGTFNGTENMVATLQSAVKNQGAKTIGAGQETEVRISCAGLLADAVGVTFAITTPTLPGGVTASAVIAGHETIDVILTNGTGGSLNVPTGNYSVIATIGEADMNSAEIQYTTATQVYIDADCTACKVENGTLTGGSGAPISNNDTADGSDVSIAGTAVAHTSGATIDMRGLTAKLISSGSAVTVTAISHAPENKQLSLVFTNGNTTLQHGASLQLAGAVDWTPGAGSTATLTRIGTVVYEISRSA